MKKTIIIISIILLIAIISIVFIFKKTNINIFYSNEIPDGYVAVFHGGAGEITYETYIYKIDNDQANYGFEYINTTSHTVRYGSSEWTHKVTGKGKIGFTDEVFIVAKDNYAYSYVTKPNDSKIYSIEEFQSMFLMD